MILVEKSTGDKYKAEIEDVSISTPNASFLEHYVRLTQCNGIKSTMMTYTQVWKYFHKNR